MFSDKLGEVIAGDGWKMHQATSCFGCDFIVPIPSQNGLYFYISFKLNI
jgi:hypothetical protein